MFLRKPIVYLFFTSLLMALFSCASSQDTLKTDSTVENERKDAEDTQTAKSSSQS